MTAAECRSSSWTHRAMTATLLREAEHAVTEGDYDAFRRLMTQAGETAETARLWDGLALSKAETRVSETVKVAA